MTNKECVQKELEAKERLHNSSVDLQVEIDKANVSIRDCWADLAKEGKLKTRNQEIARRVAPQLKLTRATGTGRLFGMMKASVEFQADAIDAIEAGMSYYLTLSTKEEMVFMSVKTKKQLADDRPLEDDDYEAIKILQAIKHEIGDLTVFLDKDEKKLMIVCPFGKANDNDEQRMKQELVNLLHDMETDPKEICLKAEKEAKKEKGEAYTEEWKYEVPYRDMLPLMGQVFSGYTDLGEKIAEVLAPNEAVARGVWYAAKIMLTDNKFITDWFMDQVVATRSRPQINIKWQIDQQ